METEREGTRWLRNVTQFTPELHRGVYFLKKRTELEINRFQFWLGLYLDV